MKTSICYYFLGIIPESTQFRIRISLRTAFGQDSERYEDFIRSKCKEKNQKTYTKDLSRTEGLL